MGEGAGRPRLVEPVEHSARPTLDNSAAQRP
jgi:hypothetical protein